ncbi:acetyltransferase [Bacillus carboniphilus]|uniref:Acetyltransferase n=1 Tax=Bacillus carboniphilus TaxID=86663 RepID=A0ABY9JYW8_9BACI|nr:acetyltransferase [Bacillus carboniphilus]WLR42785.1 acetyltransferase [Bacillus carboniphilus]
MCIGIIGEGGHSKVIMDVIDSSSEKKITAILDDKYSDLIEIENILKGPISSVSEVINLYPNIKFMIAIGDNNVRKAMVRRLGLSSYHYISFVHNRAYMSKKTHIGYGSIIMPNATVNSGSEIGNHCIINSGAIVEHDSYISDYAHICPNATLTGNTVIGEGVQVGAGTTIIPAMKIGEWSIVGAGSTVIHDIPAFCKAVGTPANIIGRTFVRGVEVSE